MAGLFTSLRDLYQTTSMRLAHNLLVAGAGAPLQVQYFGDPAYHICGAVSGLVGRAMVKATAFRYLLVARGGDSAEVVKGFGLVEPIFHTELPNLGQYIIESAANEAVLILASGVYPPLGVGLLTCAPVIAASNMELTRRAQGIAGGSSGLEDRL